jgi:ribose 5-phosphate isomerase B
MKVSKMAIGGDHAGYQLKNKLLKLLQNKGIEVEDFGPFSEESCDYADIAHPLSEAVETKKVELGILICGSGNGIAITANKHQGIRAAICWDEELAALARQHNDANILVLPARFIEESEAIKCLDKFITVDFEGGRHLRRIEKIPVK